MISKRTVRSVLVAAAAVLCAWALAWGPQAATGKDGEPVGGEPAARAQVEALGTPVPGGPGFYSVPAYAFRPVSQSATWAYDNGDSLYNPGAATSYCAAAVSLPHGATVTKLVVYYGDDDADDNLLVELFSRSLDASLGLYTMAEVYSSGAVPAFRSGQDTTITVPVVDNQRFMYFVEARLPPSTNVKLVGIRIDYQYGVSLPLVLKNR